jgi:hypothetical protein
LITGVGKVFLRSRNKKGKTILYCHTVPAGTAFHLFFWKGRHDAKPLNHKHSASNGYQATVYDKKPGLSLSLKPAEMVLIIFLLYPIT